MSKRRAAPAVIFVYGTLRPGEGNYWIESAVRHVTEDCTAQGEMCWVSSRMGYPVVDFDAPGTVVGTLLTMDPSHVDFRAMMGMELGAGYEPRDVEVTCPDGSTVTAVAFHYPAERRRGDVILDGDWKRANAERYARRR